VKFAYRLFDLDGSGALDQNEAVTVLRDAMRSDLSQYGQRGALPKIDLSQKDSIRALVDDISSRTGTGDIQIGEFEVRLRPVRLARGPCTDSLLRRADDVQPHAAHLPARQVPFLADAQDVERGVPRRLAHVASRLRGTRPFAVCCRCALR